MSAISIDNQLVHYEVLGRGRPILLLHGWVGSWRYWVPTMQNLQLKFRVYALDLHGFGDTGRNPNRYSLDSQVKLVSDFLEAMAIPKVALVGHGLGAWVAAQYAYLNPEAVPRMMLISPPLFDIPNLDRRARPSRGGRSPRNLDPGATVMSSASIQRALQESLRAAQAAGLVRDDLPYALPNAESGRYNPLAERIGAGPEALLRRCFRRDDPLYGKLEVDIPKTDPLALRISSSDFDAGRFLDSVWLLNMPVIVVHGLDDPLIDAPTEAVWNYLTYEKEDKLAPIPLEGVRHFPMLEFDRFNRLINEFLEVEDITRLEVSERWKRRSR